MARPEQYPIKKVCSFDQAMMDRIEAYRRVASPIPSTNEAIRDLLDIALKVSGIE